MHPFFQRAKDRVSSWGHRDLSRSIEVEFVEALHGAVKRVRIKGRDFDVRIPQGTRDGQKLRLRGAGRGDPPGDVILTVSVLPDRSMRREGDNILIGIILTPQVAMEGGCHMLNGPWGDVEIYTRPCIQHGETVCVKGHGVRHPSGRHGDLLLTVSIR